MLDGNSAIRQQKLMYANDIEALNSNAPTVVKGMGYEVLSRHTEIIQKKNFGIGLSCKQQASLLGR